MSAVPRDFDSVVLRCIFPSTPDFHLERSDSAIRGAGGSAGRTSWSGKPELADYVSFYGFMLSYLSDIQPSNAGTPYSPEQPATTSVPASPPGEHGLSVGARAPIRLVLSGYSYGSMIALHLPSLNFVLDMFRSPRPDSAEAEVRLRASSIAQLRNREVQSRQRLERQGRGRSSLKMSNAIHGNSHAVSVGGYESESTSRRISRESSRQSLDAGVRKSLDRVRQKFVSRRSSSPEDHLAETTGASDVQLVAPQICYLLISPPLPPVSSFTTMFSNLSFAVKKKSSSASTTETSGSKPEVEFALHPSCAVFGDRDTFTSHRKLTKWAENLKQKPNSQFQFFDVAGAGHFWQEKNLAEQLKSSIQQWLGTIDGL